MIKGRYVAECDACGDLSFVPDDIARDLIKTNAENGELMILALCATVRSATGWASDGFGLNSAPAECKGNQILIGMIALSPLPTAEMLYKESLQS